MHTVDPAVEALQRERVARYRAERDQAAASAAMVRVDRALASGENVMDPLIGAVRAGATLGELVTLMSTRLGTYRTPMPL
ncbi:MAG TPA: methylmalonyl-CoA mutase family protein, partial [Thermomicrobiaceae bacterium]|nr:methylmalonyl-CoA mutase family protein [Thermomicrobiaceae bacterium]